MGAMQMIYNSHVRHQADELEQISGKRTRSGKHYYSYNEIKSKLTAKLKKIGIKLTPLLLLMKTHSLEHHVNVN